jgi:hypothetical protein
MSVLLPSKPIKLGVGNAEQNIGQNSIISGDSGIVINDTGDNSNIIIKINGSSALSIDKFKRLGINTDDSVPLNYRLEINDPIGDCIKLLHDYGKPSYIRNSNGILEFNSFEGRGVSLNGLIFLNGSEVTSNSMKLNYTNLTEVGNAEKNKCVVLDNDKSFYGINNLSLDNLSILRSLTMDMDSDRYSLNIKNRTGKCLQFTNDSLFSTFTLEDSGVLAFRNSGECIDISSSLNESNIQYPLQLTSDNRINNSGVGIKFNTYNSVNIKRNMSSIETIILSNENNMENSIIKFNNMKDGELLNTVTIRNDGYIICNTLLELSDKRKKNIIRKSDQAMSLEKLKKVNIYDFSYVDDEKKIEHKGVMAQELYEIIPSAVNVGEDYTVSNKDIMGYLIDSIKYLNETVEDLKFKIKQMEFS